MHEYEKLGAFYLGRIKDTPQYLLYDSKDLVTHAVCVGMTGSGKTGLCVSLLEEAAIDGIPALVIDPKGDLANLLLGFPDLKPADFEPWVNADEARAQGVDVKTFAAQTAERWSSGLAQWDQDGERIRRMHHAAELAIYTPGSDAGIPVSIMASFQAPGEETLSDREAFRDRVTSTATSILSLAGINADPVQSREHVLLSTILDSAWKNGRDLDLAGIIAEVQQPRFTKVGVLDLDSFYPAKDRFGLAIALNNLLASPGFEAWLEGVPLDIDKLLYAPNGKPRIAVFSIAHLSDSERMFFVSLLLNQTLGWVRRQSGTSSLRAILYMDEIFGYFPPIAAPPSKKPLLTLLKQARASGLGIVLATQNPVDLDYKGLANTGTWFIGRLQTERDKARVLEGLEGAATASGAGFDRSKFEQVLAGLGSRVFLLNNVHDSEPVLFQSRWALTYLRGPMTRAQIKQLMAGRKGDAVAAAVTPAAVAAAAPAPGTAPAQQQKPVVPPGITELFMPLSGVVYYEPCVVGAAQVQFSDAKLKVDEVRDFVFAAPITDGVVPVDWTNAEELDFTLNDFQKQPSPGATFAELPPPAANPAKYAAWYREFAIWVFQNSTIELLRSPSLGIVSHVGEDERTFRIRLNQTQREARDAFIEKLRQKYAPKQQTLNDRLMRARQRVEVEKQQAQSQTMSSAISIGTSLLGALFGRKTISAANMGRIGTAARSAQRIGKERSDIARAEETAESVQQQMKELDEQFNADVSAFAGGADPATEALETVTVKPRKTGINVRLVALGWR